MEYIPVKTRVLQPPQDDLFTLFNESLPPLIEGDVVLISSKVLAIHQGRCVPISEHEKDVLIRREATYCIDADYRSTPLTIIHHTFLGASGIDESNGDGYYILLPERIFEEAEKIHTHLKEVYGLTNLGVIITDSRSQPMRYGATGVALGFWGIKPLLSHAGKKDLFGREMRYERSNIVDGLASGATVIGGEVAECQPIVIARNVPNLEFKEGNFKDEIMVEPKDDIFRVLYDRFM